MCPAFQVFKLAYCDHCIESEESEYRDTCQHFVDMVLEHLPHLGKKLKVHLMLHLSDNMMDFGPTASFNTERFVNCVL